MFFNQHEHFFNELQGKDKIYCRCGEIRDTHEHEWNKATDLLNRRNEIIGAVLKCVKCGDLKNHHLTD